MGFPLRTTSFLALTMCLAHGTAEAQSSALDATITVAPLVEKQTAFGRVIVPSNDVELAIEFGNHAQSKAREILRISDARFVLVDPLATKQTWGDISVDGLPVYPWKFVQGTNFAAINPPNHILPHEMAHDFLHRFLIPNSTEKQYGTDAPDWLDEAVAVMFEFDDDKQVRRCQASTLRDEQKLIPLERFLTMKHPDLASIVEAEPLIDDFVFETKMDQETPAFYATTLAFSEFLASGTEPISLSALIGFILLEEDLSERILLLRSQGRPQYGFDLLQTEFDTWLAHSESYRCADD